MKRIVEWTLYLASPNPEPTTIMRQEPKTKPTVAPPHASSPYGTSTIAEEGLYARKGWAGRTN